MQNLEKKADSSPVVSYEKLQGIRDDGKEDGLLFITVPAPASFSLKRLLGLCTYVQ